MAHEGRFREDLYYRVGVVTIELPPLRSYKDNLEILSQVFLQQAAQKHTRKVGSIAREAMNLLHAYDFPGNVRELKNALEHAVIMTSTDQVRAEDLPPVMRGGALRPSAPKAAPASPKSLTELREQWLAPHERAYVQQLLEAAQGKVDDAAKRAGVNRVTFYRLMSKHGVKLRRTAATS
jgi:DNA-binding NtrC family response regulator